MKLECSILFRDGGESHTIAQIPSCPHKISNQPIVLHWMWFCLPGDIWRYLETFLVVITGGGATGIYYVEATQAVNILQCTAPLSPHPTKNYSAPNVNNARIEKHYDKPEKKRLNHSLLERTFLQWMFFNSASEYLCAKGSFWCARQPLFHFCSRWEIYHSKL